MASGIFPCRSAQAGWLRGRMQAEREDGGLTVQDTGWTHSSDLLCACACVCACTHPSYSVTERETHVLNAGAPSCLLANLRKARLWSSLVAQWVEDPVLSCCGWGLIPGLGTFTCGGAARNTPKRQQRKEKHACCRLPPGLIPHRSPSPQARTLPCS